MERLGIVDRSENFPKGARVRAGRGMCLQGKFRSGNPEKKIALQ